ncbi:MAG: hypothetical protein K2Y23_19205 [Cyanobacteria bacterium]|nr:hypothetical protein [Cyanobacteriota bacterium]
MLTYDENFLPLIKEVDSSGAVVSTYSSSIFSASVIIRDQGVLHGFDGTGALAMVAVSDSIGSEWSFEHGTIAGCTPAVLLVDVDPNSHVGLVVRSQPYTFRFQDFDAVDSSGNPNQRHWLADQKGGVADAFDAWNSTSRNNSLGITYRQLTVQEESAGIAADIVIWKGGAAVQIADGAFSAISNLPSRRITGGAMFLESSGDRLLARIGFYKTALHEIGHSLGLAHPTATTQFPAGQPSVKSTIPGGTVMNPNGSAGAMAPAEQRRDDYLGLVALAPTSCDITGVKNAVLR